MNSIVVDSSMAIAWLMEDEFDETADWVLDSVKTGVRLFVPALWMWEVTNAVFFAERRNRINKEYRDAALDRIDLLPVTFVPLPTLEEMKSLRVYADKHRLTAYDAKYLRIAKDLDLPLATLDRALITAARAEGVALVDKKP